MKLKFISIIFLIPTTLSFTLNPPIPVHPPNNNLTQEVPTDNIITDPLAKRWTCPATCPTNICCQNGLCVASLSDVCCGSYFCDPGWRCCGTGCIPNGAKCCGAPAYYCPASETCVTYNGKLACCEGEDCLGGGGGGSQETYATEADTTKAQTTTYVTDVVDWTWYSWTITWSYWVTFYTYYPPKTTNTLTSTITITTAIVSVTATNSAQASSSFEQLSATMTYSVPASATNPPEPTQTLPTSTASASPTGGGSATFAVNSGANRVLELGWKGMLTIVAIFGTGFLMVYL